MSWPTRRSPKRPSDYSPDSANTGIVRRGPHGVLLPHCGLLPRGVRLGLSESCCSESRFAAPDSQKLPNKLF